MMTREQALNNLSLAADADLETIRLRFAARYTLSDLQYDRTLTDGMKEVHEQHMRELEQSYKVLSNRTVISDMGSLLSLGRGYIDEANESIGGAEVISTEEALAFFALYPYDTPVLAEQRYQLYRDELQDAIESTSLEASKEPYRKELEQADRCLTIAVNYLLAGHMLNQLQPVSDKNDVTYDIEQEIIISENESPIVMTESSPQTTSRNGLIWWIIGIVVIIALMVWLIVRNTHNNQDIPSKVEQFEGSDRAQVQENTSEIVTDNAAEVMKLEKTIIDEKPTVLEYSPSKIVEDILNRYMPDAGIRVSSHTIYIDSFQYIIPIRNIDTINTAGQFVSHLNRAFLSEGNKMNTSDKLSLKSISIEDRNELMKAVRMMSTDD